MKPQMVPELVEILAELESEFPEDCPMHPMGGGNPYWACDYCNRTNVEISIQQGHDSECRWERIRKRIIAVRAAHA